MNIQIVLDGEPEQLCLSYDADEVSTHVTLMVDDVEVAVRFDDLHEAIRVIATQFTFTEDNDEEECL